MIASAGAIAARGIDNEEDDRVAPSRRAGRGCPASVDAGVDEGKERKFSALRCAASR